MYCFDTNIIIDIFHGDIALRKKIEDLEDSGLNFFITPITLCELYKGVYLFSNPEKELSDLDVFISSFQLVEFDRNACRIFGEQYAKLRKSGRMTQESDLMIASIAKAHNLLVITRNKKHFEHTGVKIEVW